MPKLRVLFFHLTIHKLIFSFFPEHSFSTYLVLESVSRNFSSGQGGCPEGGGGGGGGGGDGEGRALWAGGKAPGFLAPICYLPLVCVFDVVCE